MNKNRKFDIILIVSLVAIALIALLILKIQDANNNTFAQVYYKDELVLEIDLSKEKEERQVIVNGKQGEVKLGIKHNAIRIIESSCNSKTCVHQGFIHSTTSTIICIPNQIYIKIINSNNDIDVEIG